MLIAEKQGLLGIRIGPMSKSAYHDSGILEFLRNGPPPRISTNYEADALQVFFALDTLGIKSFKVGEYLNNYIIAVDIRHQPAQNTEDKDLGICLKDLANNDVNFPGSSRYRDKTP